MPIPRGYITFVLHCHLPYVRHPEHEHFLEEDWFYEAVAETYVPLLLMLRRLEADGVPGRITLSLSPTLCEMATNHLLLGRCARYLDQRLELAEREVARTAGTPFAETARLYVQHYREARRTFGELGSGGLPAAFAELARDGRAELIGTAVSHAILPLLQAETSQAAQVAAGLSNFQKHFGGWPEGFWLPECAYEPGLEELLAGSGLRYFFLDTHGVLLADPPPPFGVFAPLRTPAGPLALGRDVESSRQVWSADEGYPGDALYREFHRDLGFDADLDYVRPYLHANGERRYLGLKYHRVTGDVPLARKEPYDPVAARRRARRHAEQFVRARRSQVLRVRRAAGIDPLLVAPYDAELFGHWWSEGLWFLEEVLRLCASAEELVCTTLGACLADCPEAEQAGRPALSSWGQGGYFEPWVNGWNDWIYPRLGRAERRMISAASRCGQADALQRRALDQCARALLLAQASDWPFLMYTGTARDYATRRFRDLMERFDRLLSQVEADTLGEGFLSQCERTDDAFPEVTAELFCRADGAADGRN